jgi:hypothetical protein
MPGNGLRRACTPGADRAEVVVLHEFPLDLEFGHIVVSESGTESLSESGIKRMNGSTKRQCDRARTLDLPLLREEGRRLRRGAVVAQRSFLPHRPPRRRRLEQRLLSLRHVPSQVLEDGVLEEDHVRLRLEEQQLPQEAFCEVFVAVGMVLNQYQISVAEARVDV